MQIQNNYTKLKITFKTMKTDMHGGHIDNTD